MMQGYPFFPASSFGLSSSLPYLPSWLTEPASERNAPFCTTYHGHWYVTSLFGRVCSPKINQDENLTGVISFDCSPDVHGLRRNLAWSMIGPKSHALQNSISSQLDGAKEINSSKRFGIWNMALTTWLFTTGVLALYFLRRAYYKQVISKTAPPRFRRNSIFLNPDTLMDQSFLLCLETS